MDNKEIFNPMEEDTASLCDGGSQSPHQEEMDRWYVDLTAEEYAAYCVQLSGMRGAMRHRKLLMGVAIVMCVAMLAISVGEWWFYHLPFDWITAGCGALMLIPVVIWGLMPHRVRKKALDHYKASVAAGIVFTGQLIVTPEFIEKVGPTATAHIRLDQHTLFFENAQMMVFQTAGSPALVIPGRCLTTEQAAQIRRAADSLPNRNRQFIARVQCGGQVIAPATAEPPQKLWTTTFTYTTEEFTSVLKGGILRRFWKMAPWITLSTTAVALLIGWGDQQSIAYCIGYFLMFMGLFLVMNLVMPLVRARSAAANASPHDLTIKITFDTVALRMESTTGIANWVLWSDVTHVYDHGDYAEVVQGTTSNLMIPKRAIEDIPAFEMALDVCRGKK